MKIHYCWFGGNPKSEEAIKCIESWKKFCPDFEIIEWNEDNYNVHKNQYIEEAYMKKKYAFVSDYARLDIIYNEGGLYFDVDVELIKEIDDLIKGHAFIGCEKDYSGKKENDILINPGLIIYAEKGNPIIGEIRDSYENDHFVNQDGTQNTYTIVSRTTEILMKRGLSKTKGIQHLENMTIYPKEYFCPKDYYTGEFSLTDNTRSIHHYKASWKSDYENQLHERAVKLSRFFGLSISYNLCQYKDAFLETGFKGIFKLTREKVKKRL